MSFLDSDVRFSTSRSNDVPTRLYKSAGVFITKKAHSPIDKIICALSVLVYAVTDKRETRHVSKRAIVIKGKRVQFSNGRVYHARDAINLVELLGAAAAYDETRPQRTENVRRNNCRQRIVVALGKTKMFLPVNKSTNQHSITDVRAGGHQYTSMLVVNTTESISKHD